MLDLIVHHSGPSFCADSRYCEWLSRMSGLTAVRKTTLMADHVQDGLPDGIEVVEGSIGNGRDLNGLIAVAASDYILLLDGRQRPEIDEPGLDRFLKIAAATGAGMVYSDSCEREGDRLNAHPVIDYQIGSIRDDFDFGAAVLISRSAVQASLERFGPIQGVQWAGLYDLRLKISAGYTLNHHPERLYASSRQPEPLQLSERQFDYVDPLHRKIQIEMEAVATAHLKRIGALLDPVFDRPDIGGDYPVEASVVIPVRNRVRTIGEALASALGQETDFPFNVLVVDNRSDDGTGEAVARIADKDERVKRLVPERRDLGIGGCWNEAVYSERCGRYAVQLDSDDLYSGPESLQSLVALLRKGDCGMAIGSYRLVDCDLNEIPPGLIDHREWTEENGRNNALRVNGFGAPRAFVTGLIRKIGFLNASYGEDYAAALAVSRQYRIGRIFESLYLCRRWEGNTDAKLSLEQKNRNDAFKDHIRSLEILERQKLVKGT